MAHRMRPPERVDRLGMNPTVESVEKWFVDSGFARHVVGASIEGRDLAIFRRTISSRASVEGSSEDPHSVGEEGGVGRSRRKKSVLFLSLVHGNEPLGLVALLRTAEALLRPRTANRQRLARGAAELELVFFPIVNVDAYELNLALGAGCRRTNLNGTCPALARDDASACPVVSDQGVDLNRQFDFDWDFDWEGSGGCSSNYPGAAPFSEPESAAVRDVVLRYRPDAAVSFHSRARSDRALLMYPYSSLGAREMDEVSLRRFRRWAKEMEPRRDLYLSGTASETVGYTARGVSIDWMHAAANVTAFLHESGTPCGGRWCGAKYAAEVRGNARLYAHTGVKLVDLVLDIDEPWHVLSPVLALILVAGTVVTWLNEKRKGSWVRRAWNVSTSRARYEKKERRREVEMQGLVVR